MRQLDQKVEGDDYAFLVGHLSSPGMTISGCIRGIPTPMINDSGASCNVVSQETWNSLKAHKIRCTSQKGSTVNLYAYGTDKPLPIVGTFSTDVRVNEHELSNVQFFVIEGKGHALLGLETH